MPYVCDPWLSWRSNQDHMVGWPRCMSVQQAAREGWFVWPSAKEGKIALTAAQLAMHRQAVADKRYRRAVFDRTSAFARHDVERAAS